MPIKQRDKMRELCRIYPNQVERIILEYAAAEERGEVVRYRNKSGLSPLEYAKALYLDKLKKGW